MSSFDPSLSLPEPPPELLRLSEQLCTRIVKAIEIADGILPFDRYMAMALYEPGLGYYVNGLHKFGQSGDFVTAPEQGRIFATTMARQVDEVASQLGENWTLFELGAGSGAMARDLLESLEHPPDRYLILEPSAPLREVQAETLAALPANLRERVTWLTSPPNEPFDGVIIANEVIDALPVSAFEVTEAGVSERCVSVDGSRFTWAPRPASVRLQTAVDELQARLPSPLPIGYRSEICLDLAGWLKTVTEPLRRGLALFIDYGYPRTEYYHPDRSGGTLVCHYRHRAHFDPFVWPGLTDLSAFVDFTAVAEAAVDCGLEVAGFTNQTGFLLSLSAHKIVDQAEDDLTRLQLAGELKRLTLPGEMGEKFKVIGLARGFDHELSGFGMMGQLHRL
jgi:SAM-dependent MidA family methyltransferase